MHTHASGAACEYAPLAADYDRRWRHYLAATTERTISALAPRPRERILDVGCGTGVALARIAADRPTARLSGIDLTPEMLAYARRRLPAAARLAHADARRLPFADASFDAALNLSMLHYLGDPATALSEMARVLAPGGRLIVTDWCRDFFVMLLCGFWLKMRRRPLGQMLKAQELIALAEEAGLQLVALKRFRVRPLWGMMTVSFVKRIQKPART
ncbi:MAG: class I SAM-dependent methyltransferase [Gammaproteobacteria bacterium]